eukprot:scaffold92921_cov17-Tisochrysis_lutea.AAC.1
MILLACAHAVDVKSTEERVAVLSNRERTLDKNRKVEEEGGRNASKVAPEGGVPSAPPLSDGWAHPLPPPMLLPGAFRVLQPVTNITNKRVLKSRQVCKRRICSPGFGQWIKHESKGTRFALTFFTFKGACFP